MRHQSSFVWSVVFGCMMTIAGCVHSKSEAIISGRITTGANRPVAHALITVIDPKTNASVGAESDGAGNYVTPPVTPGRRSLIVQKDGFQTSVQTNLNVLASGPLCIDVRLAPSVGEVSPVAASPNPSRVR